MRGMKRLFTAMNLLMIVATLFGGAYYMKHGGIVLKGTASFGFVLVGLINLIYGLVKRRSHMQFPIAMTAGLAFAMLGDVVLNSSFVAGASIFALGHVLYFVSFCFLRRFRRLDLILSGVIFAGSALLITCYPRFDFGSMTFELVCLGYALVISFMVGKAVGNFLAERTTTNALAAAGSVLFYFSDLMLVLDWFSPAPNMVGTLCLATYYPAQCLMGHSIFYCINRRRT